MSEQLSSEKKQPLEELLAGEPYMYQGKTYSRKSLYSVSSLRKFLIFAYIGVVIVVIGGVAAWSFGVSFEIPSFLMGVAENTPVVRVPQDEPAPDVPAQPVNVGIATTSAQELESSVATSTGTVDTSVEIVSGTSTVATPPVSR